MALKFLAIEHSPEDSEYIEVSFKLDSEEFTAVPPHFIGRAQVSILRSDALDMTLAEIIGSARAELAARLIECAR